MFRIGRIENLSLLKKCGALQSLEFCKTCLLTKSAF
uniref:Uncharacterized protein n=1 Tax=Nelumbo nucifera TaxID=4432 RepID=A0A822Y9E8_NELNU|nr:TPA_asm: hypothetical protein HUJ06_009555 [Nelumbo nucifera]